MYCRQIVNVHRGVVLEDHPIKFSIWPRRATTVPMGMGDMTLAAAPKRLRLVGRETRKGPTAHVARSPETSNRDKCRGSGPSGYRAQALADSPPR